MLFERSGGELKKKREEEKIGKKCKKRLNVTNYFDICYKMKMIY